MKYVYRLGFLFPITRVSFHVISLPLNSTGNNILCWREKLEKGIANLKNIGKRNQNLVAPDAPFPSPHRPSPLSSRAGMGGKGEKGGLSIKLQPAHRLLHYMLRLPTTTHLLIRPIFLFFFSTSLPSSIPR